MSFLGNLQLNPQVGKAWGIDNVRMSVPTAAHYITLGPGENVEHFDFGNYVPMATIHGEKWSDTDGDGFRDAGELGMNGVTIYADLDNDGQYDAGQARPRSRRDCQSLRETTISMIGSMRLITLYGASPSAPAICKPTAMVTASSTKAISSYGGNTSAKSPKISVRSTTATVTTRWMCQSEMERLSFVKSCRRERSLRIRLSVFTR